MKDMTKFFIKWWVDSAIAASVYPDRLQEAAKLNLKMLEMTKADLSAGMITEWGTSCSGMEGYAITEASEEDLSAYMLKYAPVIAYKVFPILNVDQSMEVAKKAAAAMQA
jgi:hypothetical protein